MMLTVAPTQNFIDLRKVARKQVKVHEPFGSLACHFERRNLEPVKRLRHKHIVEIVSS